MVINTAHEQLLARDVQLTILGKLRMVGKYILLTLWVLSAHLVFCLLIAQLTHEQYCAELARCGFSFVAYYHYDVINCGSVKVDKTAP